MSAETTREGEAPTGRSDECVSRRHMLLAGTALAASGLSGGAALAQAHPPPPPRPAAPAGSRPPNILVIFGDDIGQTNVSAYSFGLMGYRTPNIDRIAKEGMMFTDYYAEQSCTAGRSSFITGQCTLRTGLFESGHSRRDRWSASTRRDDRRVAEAARLCNRPVRQRPSRRSQRVSADGSWLRRILWQPVSPERRGGSRE